MKSGIRSAVLAIVLLFLAGRVLGQDARLTARLAPGARGVVQRLVDSAASAGLPTEPLVRKALEGESKGADSGRIVQAVQGLLTNLRSARQLFGSAADETELVAGAAALRAGASPASLARLSGLRSREQLAVPLSVLADLLSSGIPADRAWSSVYDMASQGAPDAAFLALRDRLTGGDAQHVPGLPPQAERPPAAPVPGPEHSP